MHHLKEVEGMSLRTVEYCVFDEADRLFEMGFAAQLKEILAKMYESRQVHTPLSLLWGWEVGGGGGGGGGGGCDGWKQGWHLWVSPQGRARKAAQEQQPDSATPAKSVVTSAPTSACVNVVVCRLYVLCKPC